jgi:nitroreductase/SAM-dependent methyltransferase
MLSADFYQLASQRRSTRRFQERPVPDAVIRRLIAAATEAPTACNRQLWQFVVITDPEVKALACRRSDAQQSYFYDAPAVVAVFYDCSLEHRNPCKTPYITAGMAIYALLLAAEAEGVGAIYLGGIRRPKGIAEAVGAPSFLENLGVVCLGYRDDAPPAPPHRPVDEVLHYNRCDLRQPRFLADIRPHLWSLRQLADFRDKLLWYKGIGIDAKVLHVNPDERFSPAFQYLTGRLGILLGRHARPRFLDVFSYNGDLVLQVLLAAGERPEKVYAYDLTPGILQYMRERFRPVAEFPALDYLLNGDPDRPAIPLPDGQIHVMSCYERLEQFEDPQPLLREMARVLAPEGRAVVLVSNRFYPHQYRYRRMREKNYALGRNWNRGPERKYEPSEILRHFRAAGLTVESVVGLQPVELKLAALAEGVAHRLGAHAWADRVADWRQRHYVARGCTRWFAQTLVFELRRTPS